MSTKEMFYYSELRRREEAAALTEARRSAYVLRHKKSGLWVGENNHWMQTRSTARQFEFETSALAYIVYIGYDPADFDLEAV